MKFDLILKISIKISTLKKNTNIVSENIIFSHLYRIYTESTGRNSFKLRNSLIYITKFLPI